MKKHFYDNCDHGICLNCDRCTRPECCEQFEECDGHNWDFLTRLRDEMTIKEEETDETSN
jgi:hypothetical protein